MIFHLVYAMTMADKPSVDAGFAPQALDPVIEASRDRLSKVVADVERIRGALEPQLNLVRERLDTALANPGIITDATLLSQAERMIEWLERYSRTALTFTKVLDETARLRSFVAGGHDSRPDLSSLSDSQLAKIVQGKQTVATKIEEG